ncbi:MAG: preprotein translocase subunit SecG [Balneolaceae bacterium]|nr:preprotein translocase subunit SecG [Balneolaceae bacterium]
MLYNILVAVIAIICALLILVILLQSGQGGGVSGMGGAGAVGGGHGGLGARRTADLLSKATSILGGVFLVLCVLANFAIDREEGDRSILQNGGTSTEVPIDAPANTPSAIPQTPDSSNN